MILNTQCPYCGRKSIIQVNDNEYKKWKSGTLIQNAFPNFTPDQREQIMTGICNVCWDETFKEK